MPNSPVIDRNSGLIVASYSRTSGLELAGTGGGTASHDPTPLNTTMSPGWMSLKSVDELVDQDLVADSSVFSIDGDGM